MDEKLPKMWVQGFVFFFLRPARLKLKGRFPDYFRAWVLFFKGKKSSSFPPGSRQTLSSEVNTYLAVPVNQAFTYQLCMDNLF